MKRFLIRSNGFVLFKAGLPNFPRNFTRDSIISAILTRNPVMLRDQLSFCALKQGKARNPHNGEEPGKIFHEYPGVIIKGMSTEFNASDTTALFLIGHEVYEKLTGDKSLTRKHKKNIKLASNYIVSHLKDNLFIESPEFCGAKKFALKATYWKDSHLPDRAKRYGIPDYPVVYTLAHIQNMRGLRSAAKLLDSRELEIKAEKMLEGLHRLFDQELGVFYIAIDRQGPIRGINSDSLHSLFYLNPDDLPTGRLERIIESSKVLETQYGYRTLDPKIANRVRYVYHTKTIWSFEQAIINIAAKKFGLNHVMEVSSRIMKWLDTDPEIFIINNKGITKGGCDPQLWTIAAKKYFNNPGKKYFV